MKSNDYQELKIELVALSVEDIVRTSNPEKVTNLDWVDVNDNGWNDVWHN